MPRRALELFSGTGSVRKVLEARGWEVTSLDLDPKAGAEKQRHICCDICEWDYRAFEPGHWDYIHASPVCTEFSRALTTRPRDLAAGDKLVDRVLEILTHLRPQWWSVENPDSLMKTRPNMQHLRAFMKRCCYCVYSDDEGTHSYRKPTCVWSNLPWEPRPMCTSTTPCRFRQNGCHPKIAQRGTGRTEATRANANTRNQLYSMPPALVQEWVDSIPEGEDF
jgi:Site-specific DNA methylase